ncbi:MAG: hypothetical protein DMG36_11930 [Acidobacteria bacterium]|nr:MAG: hypothetical protein DMG36_11930 [Acidobacteriota bacterium]
MRFSRWCLLSAFGFLAFHSSAALARHGTANASHAQRENAILVVTPDQKAVTLADFAWLSGRWEGQLGAPGSEKQLSAEQQWMPPKNGTMQGFFRLTDNEKTIVIELFTIRETAAGIIFYFRHFSPELKPWEGTEAYHLNLTKWDANAFRFDNPVMNQLKDAILTRNADDTYTSHGDITGADGKPTVIEVTYHRVK